MGYTLRIGEAEVCAFPEDGLEQFCTIDAAPEHHLDAPADGSPTDHTNSRWPGYSAWSQFCRDAEISHLFYDGSEMRGGHPGAFPIEKEFVEEINKAHHSLHNRGGVPSHHIWRMDWLHYWTNWAFENCDNPVFTNC